MDLGLLRLLSQVEKVTEITAPLDDEASDALPNQQVRL